MSLGKARLLFSRRPEWRRLWASEALSLVGDWFSLVAVSVVSLKASGGGVLALAVSLGAHLLPQALLAPMSGLFADRFDRKRILIGASLLEAALTLAMLASVHFSSIGWLQLFLFARASVSAFRAPASGAALPRLVRSDEIVTANSIGAVTWSLAFATGMALGGFATQVSPLFALGVDALTFLASALWMAGLPPLPARDQSEAHSPVGAVRTAVGELKEALVIGAGPELRQHVFGKMPIALMAGAGWILLNLIAEKGAWFAGGAATLGVLQSVRGMGTGIGPVVAVSLTERGVRRGLVEHSAVASVVVGLLLLATSNSAWLALVGALAWGSGAGANWVLTTTRIQERGPAPFLGRLLALDSLSFTVAMTLSAYSSALFLERGVPLQTTVIGFAIAGVAAWILLRLSGSRLLVAKTGERSARPSG